MVCILECSVIDSIFTFLFIFCVINSDRIITSNFVFILISINLKEHLVLQKLSSFKQCSVILFWHK